MAIGVHWVHLVIGLTLLYFYRVDHRGRFKIRYQQQVLFENTARNMGDAPEFIKIRHIGNCLKADPAYGKGVADAMGISLDKVK